VFIDYTAALLPPNLGTTGQGRQALVNLPTFWQGHRVPVNPATNVQWPRVAVNPPTRLQGPRVPSYPAAAPQDLSMENAIRMIKTDAARTLHDVHVAENAVAAVAKVRTMLVCEVSSRNTCTFCLSPGLMFFPGGTPLLLQIHSLDIN
jgi:hypothetical protein